jgi:hypothetical protein
MDRSDWKLLFYDQYGVMRTWAIGVIAAALFGALYWAVTWSWALALS